MLPLPETIIALLTPFAPMFSKPVWGHVQVLLLGAILCRGRRTVASVLRVMGLGEEKGFGKYHRVLSRARWSGLQGSKILLGLLVLLRPPGWPLLIGVDETIERRGGKRIKAKGCYRDAVRSTNKVVVKCYGLKWISMMLLVPLPWSSRVWALPFLTVLAPSARANEQAGRRHKTVIDWTVQLIKLVSRWLGRRWVLIGDGGYACVRLALACAPSTSGVTLISRLRLDAQLYAFPGTPGAGRRGPKPKKGVRLRPLSKRLGEVQAFGKDLSVRWYGGQRKTVRILSDTCLWHTAGWPPVAIRWVLVVDPDKPDQGEAFFSTDQSLKPEQIIEWFVLRWNVEVTFEESRRHLGIETQRQWSDLASARTTPALLGLFSILCWLGYHLHQSTHIVAKGTAWYPKSEATFSDLLAQVRRTLWADSYFNNSRANDPYVVIPRPQWDCLIHQLVEAA